MKKTLFVAVMSLMALSFTACKEKNPPQTNDADKQEVTKEDEKQQEDLKPGEMPTAKTEEAAVVKPLFEEKIAGKPIDEVRSILAKLGFVQDVVPTAPRVAHKIYQEAHDAQREYYYQEGVDPQTADFFLILELLFDKSNTAMGFNLYFRFNKENAAKFAAVSNDVQASVEAIAPQPDLFIGNLSLSSMTPEEKDIEYIHYSDRILQEMAEAVKKGDVEQGDYDDVLAELAETPGQTECRSALDKHFGANGWAALEMFVVTGELIDREGFYTKYEYSRNLEGNSFYGEIVMTYIEGACYEVNLY